MKVIPIYNFYKHKYGKELLVDVIDVDKMKADIKQTPVYITTFYSIILFTEGEEDIAINGNQVKVKPGVVVCSRPGEIWKWNPDTQLKGLHLLFEEEFLLSFFNDSLFLSKFPYLQADRKSPFLLPSSDLYSKLRQLYLDMRKEINEPAVEKDQHMLRALLYETLMVYNRIPVLESAAKIKDDMPMLRYIAQFQQLVESNYKQQHDVEFYADQLFITSNYLNKMVKQSLGMTTKQYILSRIMTEAKRMLDYTSLSVAEIAQHLHFESSTYFVRLFHRVEGVTPNQYRDKNYF
jgi:AraC-like DNA-binding protein